MEPLSREEALQILTDSPVAHLGVIFEGKPYVTPMSFVVDGERILFRTQPGRKFLAIGEDPSVCIEVSRLNEETGAWVSVIVTGTATESLDEATGQLIVERLFEKYSKALGSPLGRSGLQPISNFPHVVEVKIETLSGLSSGRLFPRTRPGRL